MRVLSRIKDWMEKFAADDLSPEEILELRAREGTLLDDLREAKEGAKQFLRELSEPDEDDYIYAYYDNQGLDEMIEEIEEMESWIEYENDFEYLIATGKEPPPVCGIGIGLGFDED